MAETRVTRKLAAIVATDMVGYSRLIGLDEAGTITRQKAHRKDLIDPKIAEYNGRIVKSTGDGLLIEFASAVDAVLCAVAVQRAMAEREADIPEDRRIRYRVGINLGEIVIDGDDILGDGVNVAARLETLAEPGGIRISEAVFQNVKGKLDLGFADLGSQKVKNIADPVSTYRVLLDPEDIGKIVAAKRIASRQMRWAAAALAAVLLLVVTGVVWWQPWIERVDPARPSKMAFALPKKPSIAVLPFDNLTGDKAQDHLADGLSENIIQALSKATGIFVIARNSTFVYKGKPVKVQQVAEELGVKYVLEGSVQKSGERIRVTAQLIDAITGRHLWSERYDRNLRDLFAVQDELTRKIVIALEVELTQGEQARVWHRPTNSLEAWGYVVRGSAQFRRFDKSGNARARELFERAVSLDPKYAFAWTLLAWTHVIDAQFGYSTSRAKSFAKGIETAKRALAVGPSEPDAHALLSYIYTIARKYDQAVAEGRKALELGPNMAAINSNVAMTMRFVGNFDEAVRLGERAVRLSPRAAWYVYWSLGTAYALNRQHSKAIATLQQALSRATSDSTKAGTHRALAFAYSEAGQSEKARQHIAALLKINPRFTSQYVRKITFYKDQAHLERVLAALGKAGLPDYPRLPEEKLAFPLPNKPSIAVLPFNNLSGDTSQEYLADGLSENIIQALSKSSEIFVLARSSSFTYRGKAVKVQRVAKEMGVRYVLEGSVQKSGDRIRVTAQLIDAVRGHHLWSETYDRKLDDLFTVQDDITRNIVVELKVSLTEGEQARLRHSSTKNLQAWGYYVRALTLFRRSNKANNAQARELTKRAIALDPGYFAAWRGLAWTHWFDARFGWSKSRAESFKKAVAITQKALALDPEDPEIHMLLSGMYLVQRQFDKAVAAGKKSVELGPNLADARAVYAWTLFSLGKWDEAILSFESALRLSPRAPAWYYGILASTYIYAGKYDLSVAMAQKALAVGAGNFADARFHYTLAFAHIEAGHPGIARKHLAEARKLYPRSSIEAARRGVIFKNPAHLERMLAALRKAGLPEHPPGEMKAPPLSIVVLPFDNLSSDKSQAYLADAITDQLTTYLARFPSTFVIARNTAFTYKGKAVDVKRVGKELGVRYVLEGSIQVASERIRVNAQLINAETGAHLWAETFDNTLRNRLQLQDEIVTRVARSLQLKLSILLAARPPRDESGKPDAQALADRCGSMVLVRGGSVKARREALSLCRQALKIDPNNARALAILASMYALRVAVGLSKDRAADIKRVNELAARAMKADPDDYVSHIARTWAASVSGRHAEAIAAAQRVLELNPSHVFAYMHLCAAHLYVGKPEKTIELAEKAMRLSPRDPFMYSFVMFKGRGLFMLGRDDEAISLLRRSVALNPRNQQALVHLAAVLGAAGREAEAREILKAFLALKYARSRTIALWKQELRTTNAKYVATFERLTEGLRKAGMPEN